MEPVTNKIAELIEQFQFDELSESDKQLVLREMTPSAYDRLYQTSRLLRQFPVDLPPVNPKQKSILLDHFISRRQTIRPLWATPVQLWKAASIVLLLGAGWLIHWQTYKDKQVEYITQLDTVYMEREVPVKIYDTVYYKEENHSSFVSQTHRTDIPHNGPIKRSDKTRKENYSEPAGRGMSAKDDSLIQSFKFVTL